MLSTRAGMSDFFRNLVLILFFIFLFGCKSAHLNNHNNLKIKFLSEYILPGNLIVDKTLVGGLSGIDFYQGAYYLACDDTDTPRIYEASFDIENYKISNVSIDKAILIKDPSDFLDIESIRVDPKTSQILLTSEGQINRQKDPVFIAVNSEGEIVTRYKIPEAFHANSLQKPRDNATLEGLCLSFNKKGFWLGMELPLVMDGLEPRLTTTKSPVRITYINSKTKKPEKQFGYLLDPVAKKPKSSFMINGLTDLVEYDTDMFLVIERSYSSGLGNQGNTIKIFKVNAAMATNTLHMNSLKDAEYIPAKKELLFNFEHLRDQLTDNSIDNIEGITFGPMLPNGHKSLILVSDNNFNRQEKQLNQFILLELIED